MKRLMLMCSVLLVFVVAGCGGSPAVYINEIMASNLETIADEDGDFSDWIELYNAGAVAVNLKGYFLSDTDEDPLRWQFPAVTIAPGEHLLVWASGKDRTGDELHTNFRINMQGEPIILTAPNGKRVVDRVEARYIPRDVSYGRWPDGGREWFYFLEPTPGRNNEETGGGLLEHDFFGDPGHRPIPVIWLALVVLLAIFLPLFAVFIIQTRR